MFSIFACNHTGNRKVVVDFNSPSFDSTTISFHEDRAVHVAIASLSSPRESYGYYNELLDYIASRINVPIHSIQKQSYQEVNQLILDGAVDFAFIGTGAYIEMKANQDVRLLVAPVIDNVTHYHAYLITHNHSGIRHFEDLRGMNFAFTDPLSHTGYNYPLYRLKQLKENPDQFFAKTLFSFGHDFSIEMVNREIVDGAYVHGLIYDYLAEFRPEKIANTQIIEISEAFGIPPIVCPAGLDPKRFELYQDIFLHLHQENLGKAILNRLNIDRFERIDDRLYNDVRNIKNSLRDEKR